VVAPQLVDNKYSAPPILSFFLHKIPDDMTTMTDRKIDFRHFRNYILDNNVTERDTRLLNAENFDNLVLEHRGIYKEGIAVSFYFLRVLINEDIQGHTSLNRIQIVRENPARYERDVDPKVRKGREFESLSSEDKKIYQCHQCGNIVNANGSLVRNDARAKKTGILEKFKDRLSPIGIDICKQCIDSFEQE
jgi:hypothetical protein